MGAFLFLAVLFLNVFAASADEFQEAGLKAHNEYRAKHGVPPLILNGKLCKLAQAWADYLASKDLWFHRPHNKYGENLYAYWHSNPTKIPTAEKAVSSWYNEIYLYDYNNPANSKKTGHFTALIWKNTKELGIAKARSKKTGKTYIVANYNPPGNYKGRYAENVLPRISSDSGKLFFNNFNVYLILVIFVYIL